MGAVLPQLMGADVLVLGTPLYFNNVPGTLKAFADRMTATGRQMPTVLLAELEKLPG